MARPLLLVVDLQNDYFPEGRFPLEGIQAAAAAAARLIEGARAAGVPIVHVRHEEAAADAPFFVAGTAGAEIHPAVAPLPAEPVVVKHHVNAFRDTGLDAVLKAAGATEVLVVGAMSHMCVDAATRAALDLGYRVTVAPEATATLALEFGGVAVPAVQVQATMMAALGDAGAAMATADDILAHWQR